MIRVLNILLALACGLALIGVYGLKYQSEGVASQRMELVAQIAAQQDRLSLLRADWAYVNQPGYVEPIIARHADMLNLVVIGARQFKSIEELPMRPAEFDPNALADLLHSLDAGVDPIAALIEAN